jgi:hypothetical protein
LADGVRVEQVADLDSRPGHRVSRANWAEEIALAECGGMANVIVARARQDRKT